MCYASLRQEGNRISFSLYKTVPAHERAPTLSARRTKSEVLSLYPLLQRNTTAQKR
jgi:hypothetical protein